MYQSRNKKIILRKINIFNKIKDSIKTTNPTKLNYLTGAKPICLKI